MKPEELTTEQETKLNTDELEAASGGTGKPSPENTIVCPNCGSTNCRSIQMKFCYLCTCRDCTYQWTIGS